MLRRTACADSHTAALADGNVPLNVISRQVGHASSSVTVRYLDHIPVHCDRDDTAAAGRARRKGRFHGQHLLTRLGGAARSDTRG